jgi:DHA1 family bicyclomycin/chloramphenicol resistance-like MFS transporter
MLQPHSRALVILLGALTGLTALSIDMSLPALPTLAAVFAVDADQAALTLSLFLAGYSVSQLFYGPLADQGGVPGRSAPADRVDVFGG